MRTLGVIFALSLGAAVFAQIAPTVPDTPTEKSVDKLLSQLPHSLRLNPGRREKLRAAMIEATARERYVMVTMSGGKFAQRAAIGKISSELENRERHILDPRQMQILLDWTQAQRKKGSTLRMKG